MTTQTEQLVEKLCHRFNSVHVDGKHDSAENDADFDPHMQKKAASRGALLYASLICETAMI